MHAVAHIQEGWIYPLINPERQRLAWIDGDFIFAVKDGASVPKCFISENHIFWTASAQSQRNTRFFIEGGYVYGPNDILPWL